MKKKLKKKPKPILWYCPKCGKDKWLLANTDAMNLILNVFRLKKKIAKIFRILRRNYLGGNELKELKRMVGK